MSTLLKILVILWIFSFRILSRVKLREQLSRPLRYFHTIGSRQTDETNYHIQPSYVTNCTSQSRDLLLFTLLPPTRRRFCREYLPTYIQFCFPEFTIYVLRLNYVIRGESLRRFCLLDFLYFEYQTDKRISENFTLSSSLMCIEPADLGMMTMEQM